MAQSASFSSGIALASFVTSSVLLRKSWDVITSGIVSNVGEGISWKVYKEPDSGLTIIAFEVTQDSSNLQEDLVPSNNARREKIFHHFEFLCTKKAPFFSVNSTAISLLDKNYEQLDQLKSEINSSLRLIVTGLGLGGAIASLFTLSLLDTNDDKKKDDKKKPPLCITFGSPLVGNKKLQEAISRSSIWSSCFLHVVSNRDPLPKRLNRHINAYMPFGTFLFCSDVSSTCFENPQSVLELVIGSIHDQNQGSQPIDYGKIVENLYRKAICKDFTPRGQDLTHSNSLRASICLQLWAALGLTPDMQQQQQQDIDINTMVTKMEELEKKFVFQKRRKFDPSKKLNEVKINMAQLEWYKKDSKTRNIGYYDRYKNTWMPADKKTKAITSMACDQDASGFCKNLTTYWKEMVEEVEMKPQKEGVAFRTRWLYGGTNYRRMVEPFAIAEFYAKGGEDYVANGRSRHYEVLEKWLEEGKKDKSDTNSTSRKNVELILTIDSCFWAKAEEALLQLENVNEKEEAKGKLHEFEEYIYGSLKKYEVSPEIFLEHSSYMTWWNRYKGISGNPALASFMSNPHHYVQYTEGNYIFP